VTSAATVKLDADVAVPLAVVTTTGPVVVPAPTIAVNEPPVEVLIPVAAVPFTVTLVGAHKLVPEMVIKVLAFPAAGVNELIVGAPVAVHTTGVPVKQAAGTFTTVPLADAEIDHGVVHCVPFTVIVPCAWLVKATAASPTNDMTVFDIRIQKFFI
jgi:hypothetical protein